MCPKKCVTPHSGSVADRTDFLANSKKSTCKKRLKVEGGSSPIRPGPHRVQRTDLPYFCGEVRNTGYANLNTGAMRMTCYALCFCYKSITRNLTALSVNLTLDIFRKQ
ncbi:hypothetical protein AVEN_255748-1 [Araneus ventricosus]|uniref:Uncharacterized protein n=1 Tax=Araneus ventricosus TaxID=182803 RepID=A0A4Y2UB59_ARAVE|nr:hypothetical protein AVEN_51153-1 [Araneus ventricosus]GBO08787.1 hypothetical protein AVEN_255748-1 [Araneus ventricosus]